MSNFLVALYAVFPFLFYIAFGYGVKRTGLTTEPFLRTLNQMVFQAFFPIMMFYNLYDRGEDLAIDGKLMALGVSGVIVLILLLCLIVPRIVKENPKRGVIIQGIYRSNFVLFAIPLTENVFGKEGAAMAATMVAVIVPLYNVAAVIILEYYRGGRAKLSDLVKKIITNPLILGAIVGFFFVFTGIKMPETIDKPLSQFSGMSTPLALFVLGGTLKFSSIRKNARYLIPSLTAKMVVIPAVMMAITVPLGLTAMERFVVLMIFATPVAASSYPMAQNMGGDGDLAGEFVVISTAVSVFTIFLWIFGLKTAGLI